jgi:hypothetical protein
MTKLIAQRPQHGLISGGQSQPGSNPHPAGLATTNGSFIERMFECETGRMPM